MFGYSKEEQGLKSAEKSYAGIDLDEWARRFLSAMDTFFLPQYAVPACILDKQSYQSILEDKRKIASSIADSVEGIAEGTGGDEDQAKELLRQRMLVSLSAAYDVDAIVQIGVLVESPFDFFPESAPKFYGQPVAKLSEAKLPAPGPDQLPEKPATSCAWRVARREPIPVSCITLLGCASRRFSSRGSSMAGG